MASDSENAAPKLRWLRALVAAFVAELVLVLVAAPIFASTQDATPILNAVIPPASFIVFVGAGYWAARPVGRNGVAQGALAGAWAVALYLALGAGASLVTDKASFSDGLTTAYLIAHALKIIGGAVGGWLMARKAAPTG
jgi:putative membrane protein (TIGR04086 family)